MLSICSSRFDISLIIPRLKTNQLNSTFVYTYHEIIEIHFRKEESIKSAFVVFKKKCFYKIFIYTIIKYIVNNENT